MSKICQAHCVGSLVMPSSLNEQLGRYTHVIKLF